MVTEEQIRESLNGVLVPGIKRSLQDLESRRFSFSLSEAHGIRV